MFPAHCDTLKKNEQKLSSPMSPLVQCRVCVGVGVCRAARLGWARRDACIRPSFCVPQPASAAMEPRVRTHTPSCTAGVHTPAHACPHPSPRTGIWVPVGVRAPGLMLRIDVKVEVMSQIAQFILWLQDALCMKKTL